MTPFFYFWAMSYKTLQQCISDLDKKRIMRQIEANLKAKGMTISNDPDLLVSLFTKERERIDVYNNNFYGFGYGYGAWYGGGSSITSTPEGTLYIDLIDHSKNELVWQGIGRGYLSESMKKKEERIKEFVSKIMEKYPPGLMKK